MIDTAAGGVPAAEGVPVTGEAMLLEAVQPSNEQLRAEASNRRSRTGQQVFSAGALVTVLVWGARLRGIDLNPMPDEQEIPAEVAGAITACLAYLAAVAMNRAPAE